MFASKTVTEHILRGIAGFGSLAGAVTMAGEPGATAMAGSVALALVALVVFRGCPVCWTVGLMQTLGQRLQSLRLTPR